MLQTKRYRVSHPLLRKLVKYFWVIESRTPVGIDHKLLPVNNIDLILSLSSPIKYITDQNTEIVPKGFHFNGFRDKYYRINQSGPISVFGISFFHAGLFPVIRTPLSEFANKTTEADLILKYFAEDVSEIIRTKGPVPQAIRIIENELVKLVDVSLIPEGEVCRLFQKFHDNMNDFNIGVFCEQNGIHKRKLERVFNRYIGTSPKLFQRVSRFQDVVSQLQKNNYSTLTAFAYDNNYYDQTHFIKDFKSFTGSTPMDFLEQKSFVKQIIEYR